MIRDLLIEKVLKQMGFFIVKELDLDRFNPLLRPLDCENDAQARLLFRDFISDNQFLAYKNISFRQNITKQEMAVVVYVMTYRDSIEPMVKIVAKVNELLFDHNYKLSAYSLSDERYIRMNIESEVRTFFDKVILPWMLSRDFTNNEFVAWIERPTRESMENFKRNFLGFPKP